MWGLERKGGSRMCRAVNVGGCSGGVMEEGGCGAWGSEWGGGFSAWGDEGGGLQCME